MKLLFMGTGAADWVLKERKDGEFFRRFTSIKINSDLMIDCPADAEDYLINSGESLCDIQNLLITHTHNDHYDADTIKKILNKGVKIWTEKNTVPMIEKDLPSCGVCCLDLYTPSKVGEYEVICVPANHSVSDKNQIPLHYIITKGDKTIFWGCDGAWLPNYSWKEVKKYKYDLIVLDGTLGEAKGDYRTFEHNNISMIIEMSETMRSCGLLKPEGKIAMSHMSRYAHKSHSELQKSMAETNIIVAYDGMELEL
ncbi:MAG: hypothetical protein K5768_01430 [Firmicutes bacterium]|nr:hypothetical protein [Bacillota bacterium]